MGSHFLKKCNWILRGLQEGLKSSISHCRGVLQFPLLILCSIPFSSYSDVTKGIELSYKNPVLRALLLANNLDERALKKNIDAPLDQDKNTLLYYAVQESELGIAGALIKNGASIECLIRNPPSRMLDCLNHPERKIKPLFFDILHQGIIQKGARPLASFVHFLCQYHYLKKGGAKINKQSELIIPHMIHQIWIGPNPLPKEVKGMMATWQKMHPHWEYKLWTNRDAEEFEMVNRKAFDTCINWGAKSDIFRCEILEKLGGIYIDIDFECLLPFDELNAKYDFYCGLVGKECIANGLIAARPHHPIIKACIDEWQKRGGASTNDNNLIMEWTGPYFFTDRVMEYLSSREGVESKGVVFPEDYFFPFPNNQRAKFWSGFLSREQILQKYKKPETFAVHYWRTSWQ